MGVQFVSASSQFLENTSPPVTAVSFTVGMWVYPAQTAASETFWSIANGGATTDYFELTQNTSTGFSLTAASVASGGVNATSTITITANSWYFLLGRAISSTNRLMAVLAFDGRTAFGSNTTSAVPATLSRSAFGTRDVSTRTRFLDGVVAEYFMTNTDIQVDGAQIQTSTLLQLAYNGPFSIPHIAKDVIEYRSFRKGLGSDQDSRDEVYWGGSGRQTWTNNATATLSIAPPFLSSTYAKPNQKKRILMV